jgi:hypothetical protein
MGPARCLLSVCLSLVHSYSKQNTNALQNCQPNSGKYLLLLIELLSENGEGLREAQ